MIDMRLSCITIFLSDKWWHYVLINMIFILTYTIYTLSLYKLTIGSSLIGRAPDSESGGCRFESYFPNFCFYNGDLMC